MQNLTDDEDSITLSLSHTHETAEVTRKREKNCPLLSSSSSGTNEKKNDQGDGQVSSFPSFQFGEKNPVFVSILRPHFLPSLGDFNELARQKNPEKSIHKKELAADNLKRVCGKL